MNLSHRFAVLGTVVIVGCSAAPSSNGNEQETVSEETSSLDGSQGCDEFSHTTLTEGVEDYATNALKAGVTVCASSADEHGNIEQDRHAQCGTTGANGVVQLPVKNCRDVRVTFSVDGYVSANQLLRIHGDLTTGTRMISTALAGQLAQFLGSSLDLTKAQPVFTAYDPAEHPLAGVATTLHPANGTLYYVATNGAPSASLTATTAAGVAGVLNARPGEYIVQGTPPAGMHCDIGPYVPGPTPNSIRIEAIAGSAGEAVFHCQ